MAFRKKAQTVTVHKPDILIIQESEHPDKLGSGELSEYPHCTWAGSNKNKGLLVMSRENYPFTIWPGYTEKYRYILPLKVQAEYPFILLGVWAQNCKEEPAYRYIGQVWKALNEYEDLLDEPCIIAGDFNSNAIWGKGHPGCSHQDTVELLHDHKIESLYHRQYGEEQGSEKRVTYYFQKNLNKGFHIDYCFASKCFFKGSPRLSIPGPENWIKASDHAPLFIDFRDESG